MAKCKLLAFLLCESASVAPEPDNRVTLHHLFDRMTVPRNLEKAELVFAYYKIVVEAPCMVTLRVIDPQGREVPGNRQHSIERTGPVQGVWALQTGLFKEAGPYFLELKEETDGSEPHPLASMRLIVSQESQ